MAATTWHDQYQSDPTMFVMLDGSTITEPATEISGSGRRVRIKGMESSAPAGMRDEAVLARVDEIAAARKTRRWFTGPTDRENLFIQATTEPLGNQNNALYVTQSSNGTYRDEAHMTWTFEHKTLPVVAVIGVRAVGTQIETRLVTTNTTSQDMNGRYNQAWHDFAPMFYTVDATVRESWREFVKQSPVNFAGLSFETQYANTERELATIMLEQYESIDDLPYLEVPDTRDMSKPGWLRLELVDTTYSGSIRQALTTYLQTLPSIADALKHYEAFRESLREAGMHLGPINEMMLVDAIEGHNTVLEVDLDLHGVSDQRGAPFRNHSLFMHLDSATFVVTCGMDGPSQDETALAWEEAQMIAQLTGTEPELLAFAKAHAASELDGAARKLVKKRRRQRR